MSDSMSEKQKTLVALTLAHQTCNAALAFLSNPEQAHDPTLDGSNLPLLHRDFLSFLSFIYASITKISLVLKPSSPSYTAAQAPLTELTNRIAALPHCVRLLQTDHGRTFATEAEHITKDVLEAVKSLMQTFITIDAEVIPSQGKAGDEYMVRTGAIHDVIERARAPDGFSRNNLIAVRKIWKSNQESLEDGLNEVRETMESAENTDEDEDGVDDGWGELGLSSRVKPSLVELERIKQMYLIVRLSSLLHQRVLKDVLFESTSTLIPSPSKELNKVLDNMAQASVKFFTASDNFISTMYPPQSPEQMRSELKTYQARLANLQSSTDPLISEGSLEETFKNLQIDTKKTDNAKLRKWYIACISQINQSINKLDSALNIQGNQVA